MLVFYLKILNIDLEDKFIFLVSNEQMQPFLAKPL